MSGDQLGAWLCKLRWNLPSYIGEYFISQLKKLGNGFKYFLIFILIWGRFPFWLIFFRWVETTRQKKVLKQPVFHGSCHVFGSTDHCSNAMKVYELWSCLILCHRGSSTTLIFPGWFTSFTHVSNKDVSLFKREHDFSKRWQRRSGYHDTMIIWRCGKFTFPSRQRHFISGWTLNSDLAELKGVLALS